LGGYLMAQPVQTYSITAPGVFGLNTQDSPVDMDAKYALEANNCVIDKSGRIASRMGWTTVHDSITALGTNDIQSIGELIQNDGTSTVIAAGNNKLFKLVAGVLSELTYGGGGAAPTITANLWQMATLNDHIVLFQEAHNPLVYNPATSTTTYRRITELSGAVGTPPDANAAISAHGRIWAASTSADKNTVYWSDTLVSSKWTGGTAGSLDLLGVWPQGGDEIVALAAHNNFLIVFGKKQMLVYTGADNPSTLSLSDTVSNCDCFGRDTIQNTPEDLIFLSSGGLRSLKRTIQEKSAPITVLSRTVNDDLIAYAANESTSKTIKSAYSPFHSLYLLTFTDSLTTFCFDTRSPMQDGSYRVTTWTNMNPKALYYSPSKILYMGKAGYVGKYSGYSDNGGRYRMSYYTPWIDFGDPIRTSILKRIVMAIVGVTSQNVVFKWGFDYASVTRSQTSDLTAGLTAGEYNIGEYSIAEYSSNQSVRNVSITAGGTGKVVQVGLESQVVGAAISLQRCDVFTKNGAYK
jgi:hypothetical protein